MHVLLWESSPAEVEHGDGMHSMRASVLGEFVNATECVKQSQIESALGNNDCVTFVRVRQGSFFAT